MRLIRRAFAQSSLVTKPGDLGSRIPEKYIVSERGLEPLPPFGD